MPGGSSYFEVDAKTIGIFHFIVLIFVVRYTKIIPGYLECLLQSNVPITF
jgi:hypothetical protein